MHTMHARAAVRRDKTLLYTLALSILLHSIALMPFMKDALKEFRFPEVKEPASIPIEFELVSPPERPTPTDKQSKYLSTVSSAARDAAESDGRGDLPHGEGVVPIPDTPSREDGAEGGGASEVPPLPEENSDLGEAFRRSKFREEISPRKDLSLPEQRPDFKNEGSAQASIDGISINTTAWDFAPYLLELKHRVKQHWIPPLAFTALGAIHGFTTVRFRIMPDGRMEALEVLEEEGHESLARSSVGAIQGAAPFRPLPDNFPEDHLEIIFGFYYLLPGDEVKYFRKE
ncbi:MAG: energy transducer TonB [Chitinivibrionia bacterium]|nr:energy transducer TonB [Chitinivibrionia bacterium]